MSTRLLILTITLMCANLNAQNENEILKGQTETIITGIVAEETNGAPLPYAYLTIAKVGLGTVTDGDGKFQISIPDTYNSLTIIISYLGFDDLSLNVTDFKTRNGAIFGLKAKAFSLNEVVVKSRKMPTAKALLRKTINKIPDNYTSSPAMLSGYYRETMKENGVYIKYADAVSDYYATPYRKKKHKWREYQNPFDFSFGIGAFTSSNSLHRIHFHHRTLKDEKVSIIDSRSSSNLSKKDFESSIAGGPLGLFARNRIKYQESFLGKKANRDFNFTVSEEQDETGAWLYVLDFQTKTTKAELDALQSTKNRRQWRLANKRKLLKGRIYIDRDDFAVVRYQCAVPNNLKEYFCGYTFNAIKHFDYKLDVRFVKKQDTYFLDELRHEDEFIFKDSISQTTTYYSAISQFNTKAIQTEDVKKISKEENFANSNLNQLHEYPLEYNTSFWNKYTQENPIATIDSTIRKDMEFEKSLEKQFHDKHVRNDSMPAPVAKKEPSNFKIHGENYTDDYAWLKDTKAPKNNEAVMKYLREENKYTENYNIPLRRAQRNIYKALVSTVEKNSTSLPTKENGYHYYTKYTEDDEYPVYYRKAIENDTLQEELLNVNTLAKDKIFYTAGLGPVSPNNNLAVVYENTTGTDNYVLKIKDLKTKSFLTDSIPRSGAMVWLNDTTFLYSNSEKQTLRSSKILRHVLGTSHENDTLIYEENDPSFNVGLRKSKSKDYIFLTSNSSTSSETLYLKTDSETTEFKTIKIREKDHIYSAFHYKNQFYLITNKNAVNYKIVSVDIETISKAKWRDVIPHQEGVLIQGIQIFDNYLVLNEKENAQSRIRIIDQTTQNSHHINFKEEYYNIGIGYNPDFATDSLQFNYSSFETPSTVYKYHMQTKQKRVLKQHKKSLLIPFYKYNVERKWVPAKDGKLIPLTLISHKWRKKQSDNNRVYLTSYGAYGSGQGINRGAMVQHLVNAGYVYAIAHVRGGDDMGNEWHEDGKLFNKKNTFTDFISCAEYLIAEEFAVKGSIIAEGASAGGLLMGAIANERPELFNTVILNVPFVDVINTMLDEKLPLTTGEFEEWGNPKNKKEYAYIKSYSPYDNVKAQKYPNLLFFTGLNDTRVGYWEPAKMVAKLRATKTDDKVLLLKTDFFNGHSGGSGRFASYRDAAYKLALIYELSEVSKDVQSN